MNSDDGRLTMEDLGKKILEFKEGVEVALSAQERLENSLRRFKGEPELEDQSKMNILMVKLSLVIQTMDCKGQPQGR